MQEGSALQPVRPRGRGAKAELPVDEKGRTFQRTAGNLEAYESPYLFATRDKPVDLIFPKVRREIHYQTFEQKADIRRAGIGERMIDDGTGGMITQREADQLGFAGMDERGAMTGGRLPSKAGLSEGPKAEADAIMDLADPAARSSIRFTDLSLEEQAAQGMEYWMTPSQFEGWVKSTIGDVFGTSRAPRTILEDAYAGQFADQRGDAIRVTLSDLGVGSVGDDYTLVLVDVAERLNVDVAQGVRTMQRYLADGDASLLMDPDLQGLLVVADEVGRRGGRDGLSEGAQRLVRDAAETEASAMAHAAKLADDASVRRPLPGEPRQVGSFVEGAASFRQLKGNIFDHLAEADAVVVTTNGFVKRNGRAVMGRGIAKEMNKKVKDLDLALGKHLRENGNVVGIIGEIDGTPIIAMPVKPVMGALDQKLPHVKLSKGQTQVPGWGVQADPNIIAQSTDDLVALVNERGFRDVLMPRPGAGAGELPFERTGPFLNKKLDERFIVADFNDVWDSKAVESAVPPPTAVPTPAPPVTTTFGRSGTGRNVGRATSGGMRKGKYGNRWSSKGYKGTTKTDTEQEAVELYHGWLWDEIDETAGFKQELLDDFPPGSEIRCPTKTSHDPCHAEVIGSAVDWLRAGREGRAPAPGHKMDSLVGTIAEEKAVRTPDVQTLVDAVLAPTDKVTDDLFSEVADQIEWFYRAREVFQQNLDFAKHNVSMEADVPMKNLDRLRQVKRGQEKYTELMAAYRAEDWEAFDRIWAADHNAIKSLGSMLGNDGRLVREDLADGTRILKIDYPDSPRIGRKDLGADFDALVVGDVTDKVLLENGLEMVVQARRIRKKISAVASPPRPGDVPVTTRDAGS
jgi:hypothetical protein